VSLLALLVRVRNLCGCAWLVADRVFGELGCDCLDETWDQAGGRHPERGRWFRVPKRRLGGLRVPEGPSCGMRPSPDVLEQRS
jgi:hypothetical protein